MEENKYYTPELKEFHVGFEYKQELGYSWSINTPEDYVIEFQDKIFEIENINFINTLLEAGLIKVKYLDKDDIEELGFTYDANESGEESPSLYDSHGYSQAYFIDNQLTESKTAFLLYHFPDNFVIIDSIVNCGSGRENMLFRGTIKNKSELKDMLEKLGIGF